MLQFPYKIERNIKLLAEIVNNCCFTNLSGTSHHKRTVETPCFHTLDYSLSVV